MRVTYLTGQNPTVIELGPVVLPGAGVELPTGTAGQVVGYDAEGQPIAVSLPDGTLPAGNEGQLVGYGPGGTPIAVNAPTISISTNPNNALQLGDDGGLYVFETIGNDGGIDLTVLFDNQII